MSAMMAGAILAGCSDDDDENDGPGDPTGGLELKERKIKEIRYGGADESSETTFSNVETFEYDAEGRVTKTTYRHLFGEWEEVTTFKYSADEFVVDVDGDVYTYELENGRAVRMTNVYDDGYSRDVYEFGYSDGYQTRIAGEYWENDELWYTDEVSYTVKNGCYASGSGSYEDFEVGYEETGTYGGTMTASTVENNMNLDLYNLDNDMSYAYFAGVMGTRQKYLPETVVTTENGSVDSRTEYSYQTDDEGYITEIVTKTIEYTDEGEEYRYTQVYAITYEE